LEGGPSIARGFMRRDLMEDSRRPVFPAIYGGGKPWFGAMLKQQALTLRSSKILTDGEPVLHYQTLRK
jgi:dihydrofolate reductase